MTMTCGRARRLLWPDTGPRGATPDVVAAREHVSRCELCGRFLEDMRRMSERIRRNAPRPVAPVEVRDRLFKAIARARTEPSRFAQTRLRWRLLQALAATVLVGGTWLGYRAISGNQGGEKDVLSSIVEDRVRSQKGAGLTSSDSLEVALWLAERLPFAVRIPIFPDARLTGARLLAVNRQSGAVVEYTIGGRLLSYYVLPAAREDGRRPPREVRLASRAGYHLATWDDAGLTHALVATLPGPRLVELARYCIHQMMATATSARAWWTERPRLARRTGTPLRDPRTRFAARCPHCTSMVPDITARPWMVQM